MDTKAVRTGLGKIKGMFGGVARTAGKAFKMGGKGILAGAGIAGAAVAALGAMTIGTAKWAKNLKNISNQTGVSVKDTLALREAFREAGVEISDDADLMSDFQEKIEDAVRGGGTAGEGLPMFGLDPFAMRRITNPMQQFEILMDAVEKSQMGVQGRAFALDKILGGQGFKFVHLAKNYSKYMGQARKDTEGLANALDDQVVGELEHVLRIVNRIKIQFRMAMIQYAKALPLDKIMAVIDKVMAVSLSFLTDPGKFLKETWDWFKAEMKSLWELLLKSLTTALSDIMPKVPGWLKAPPDDEPRSLLQKVIHGWAPKIIRSPEGGGTDFTSRTLQSIDSTLHRMDRKPQSVFG